MLLPLSLLALVCASAAFTPSYLDPDALQLELDALQAKHADQLQHYAANQLRPDVLDKVKQARVLAVNLESKSQGRLRRRQEQRGVVDLLDFYSQPLDIMIYGPVSIGTPSQSFSLLMDTGSADLWVYTDGTGATEPEWDASRSSTAVTTPRQEWEIRYGKGEQTGLLNQDTVTLGGYTVNDTVFAAADSLNSAFTYYPISGIFGLGFGTLAASGYAPWFERLLRSGALAEQYFSFYFTRARDQPEAQGRAMGSVGGAQLCVGCVDGSKYEGEITWNPVVSDGFWAIESDGISLNGSLVEGTGFRAAIDTGTTLISLPMSAAERFYALIPSSRRSTSSLTSAAGATWIIPCATRLSSFGFSFQGRTFEVPPEDLLRAVSRDGRECALSVVGGGSRDVDGSEIGIIGGAFLKNAYSIFSYSHSGAPAIGLATSVIAGSWHNASSTDEALADEVPSVTGSLSLDGVGPSGTASATSGRTSRTGGLGSTATFLPGPSSFSSSPSSPSQTSQASPSASDVDASTTAHVLAGVIAAVAIGGGWMLG